ncbi:hypothetical protein NL676_018636 [Syzygium grande]|nr:hypothetical protein NL676_018636 [Syzygium grande]
MEKEPISVYISRNLTPYGSSQVGSVSCLRFLIDFVNFHHAPAPLKRHGFHTWCSASVSLEVQSRSSLPSPPLTAVVFGTLTSIAASPHPSLDATLHDDADAAAAAPSSSDDKVVHIPWLEELRKLRVAELQSEALGELHKELGGRDGSAGGLGYAIGGQALESATTPLRDRRSE